MNITATLKAFALALVAGLAITTASVANPLPGTLAPITLINKNGVLVPFAPNGVPVGPVNVLRNQGPVQLVKFVPPCHLVGTRYLQMRCL